MKETTSADFPAARRAPALTINLVPIPQPEGEYRAQGSARLAAASYSWNSSGATSPSTVVSETCARMLTLCKRRSAAQAVPGTTRHRTSLSSARRNGALRCIRNPRGLKRRDTLRFRHAASGSPTGPRVSRQIIHLRFARSDASIERRNRHATRERNEGRELRRQEHGLRTAEKARGVEEAQAAHAARGEDRPDHLRGGAPQPVARERGARRDDPAPLGLARRDVRARPQPVDPRRGRP